MRRDSQEHLARCARLQDAWRAAPPGRRPALEVEIDREITEPGSVDIDRVLANGCGPGDGLQPAADAEDRTVSLPFKTARQRAAERPPEVEWVIEGLAAVECITELDGPLKQSGKTTFVAHAVAAKLDGRPFLDRPTRSGPVVWLSEESWSTLQEALRDAGLLDRDDLYILTREDAFGVDWPEVARQARVHAIAVGADLLIGDTLASLAGLRGDDENSSGAAMAAVLPLQEIGAAGIAVLVSRHDRRAGGEVGETGRGSTAFTGAVDMVFRLTRLGGDGRDTMRKLEYIGRIRGLPPSLVINLADDGYQVVGSDADVKRRLAAELLLEHLPDSQDDAVTLPSTWKPGGPLDRSDLGKSTIREAAEALLSEGRLARREISARKHVWWCVSGAPGSAGHATPPASSPATAGCVSGGPSPYRDGHTGLTRPPGTGHAGSVDLPEAVE